MHAAALGPETVLVVEDDELVRRYVRRSLERRGYRVLEVADPTKAIELCRREHVDLLVTDIVMPGMNGWTLADRLAEIRPGLPILYTSGWADADEPQLRPRSAFLGKPFAPDALTARVRALLDAA